MFHGCCVPILITTFPQTSAERIHGRNVGHRASIFVCVPIVNPLFIVPPLPLGFKVFFSWSRGGNCSAGAPCVCIFVCVPTVNSLFIVPPLPLKHSSHGQGEVIILERECSICQCLS